LLVRPLRSFFNWRTHLSNDDLPTFIAFAVSSTEWPLSTTN
jgi:hypothetical protein